MELEGRVVIITGAARGIGRVYAKPSQHEATRLLFPTFLMGRKLRRRSARTAEKPYSSGPMCRTRRV